MKLDGKSRHSAQLFSFLHTLAKHAEKNICFKFFHGVEEVRMRYLESL